MKDAVKFAAAVMAALFVVCAVNVFAFAFGRAVARMVIAILKEWS